MKPKPRGLLVVLVVTASLLMASAAATAGVGAGATRRASLDMQGGDPDGDSQAAVVSADGRYVAFESSATDLVPDDGNGQQDVFVKDLLTGTTVRASVDLAGGDPDGESSHPSLSVDGRFLSFNSLAGDLVPDDGNGTYDVFVRDLVSGTTTRASVDGNGEDADGISAVSSISGDGQRVAFHSTAGDLVEGDHNDDFDVYVRDLGAAITIRASVALDGGDPDNTSTRPRISLDGRFVTFHSFAGNLVPFDGNDEFDVFVRDLVEGTTVRASVDEDGRNSDARSVDPVISADGRYVAFSSLAGDLVPGDSNGEFDVFVRDLLLGTTMRVSVDTDGMDSDEDSYDPSISADGQIVAFWSLAGDLVDIDRNRKSDVFVRDPAGITVRVSVDTRGRNANGDSYWPSMSADGQLMVFSSYASDLVDQDGNGLSDVFVARMAG